MKQTIKLAAIAIILVFVLGAMLSIANAPALDPVRYTEARATATAIAPAVYPTTRYNEYVLPTQQAAEAAEIEQTTHNQYEHQRTVDTIGAVARIAIIIAVSVGSVLTCVGIGLGVGGWFGARGVREIRQAALAPTRLLIEGPHITPWGVTHTVTGATWLLDNPQDARPEHARLVSATYEALPHNVATDLIRALGNGNATRAQMAQARYYQLEERC